MITPSKQNARTIRNHGVPNFMTGHCTNAVKWPWMGNSCQRRLRPTSHTARWSCTQADPDKLWSSHPRKINSCLFFLELALHLESRLIQKRLCDIENWEHGDHIIRPSEAQDPVGCHSSCVLAKASSCHCCLEELIGFTMFHLKSPLPNVSMFNTWWLRKIFRTSGEAGPDQMSCMLPWTAKGGCASSTLTAAIQAKYFTPSEYKSSPMIRSKNVKT